MGVCNPSIWKWVDRVFDDDRRFVGVNYAFLGTPGGDETISQIRGRGALTDTGSTRVEAAIAICFALKDKAMPHEAITTLITDGS